MIIHNTVIQINTKAWVQHECLTTAARGFQVCKVRLWKDKNGLLFSELKGLVQVPWNSEL